MKVSILLPTRNGSKTIPASIRSVLNQSFRDFELLVIDDGSTDETLRRIEESGGGDERVRIIRNETNLGIQKSLNKGLHAAKGEYIARIDDDDEWIDQDKMGKQVAYLDENPGCVLVGTGTIVVDENGKELYRYLNPERDQDIRDILLFRNCFTHSTVMFRRETAIASGGYSEDESVKHLEDYDLWLKMGTRGTFYNLPSYSIRFLLSPSSISGKHKVEQMRKAVVLAWKNKDIYPQACSNIAKSAVRYCIVSAASLLGLGRVLSVFSGAYKRTR